MLIFDQLKKDDRHLRALTLVVLGGLGVLLAGLWWLQVVSARDYQENLENQSFRTVRIPAVRGAILDRDGIVLAENRPAYNISLYLEELSRSFDTNYFAKAARARAELQRQSEAEEKRLHRALNKEERKRFVLTVQDKGVIRQQARCEVASNVVAQISQRVQQPIIFDPATFERHYQTRLALPFPVLTNLSAIQIHRFEEQSSSSVGVDLELRPARVYPFGTTAAHVIGHLRFDDSSQKDEVSFFSYRLPDYKGVVGIEAGFDNDLRGKAGAKSVLVNNAGYRQTENIWSPAEPGRNVVLTVDLRIQQAAEAALSKAVPKEPGPVRGAVVVMDVNSGDILAMASSPTLNPNSFVPRISSEEWRRITNLSAEKNRATQENYMPGSVFKTVVGLAALEAGWNPDQEVTVQPDPSDTARSIVYVGADRQAWHDPVRPGPYNFKRAIIHSSNAYFITAGLWMGPERIIRLAQRLHLGEPTGLNASTHQAVSGAFPKLTALSSGWTLGSTANMCIGQETVWVTPLQVAVLTSALANGGKVLWPRLVDRVEPADPTSSEPAQVQPHRPPRDELGVNPANLRVLQDAMLGETEDVEGTGHSAAVLNPGLRICGKTGTAQIQDVRSRKIGWTTWFASFAPFDNPRWAVVVMVEDGVSGGTTCAPVAGHVYQAILEGEKKG